MIEYDFKNKEIVDIVNNLIIYSVSKGASDIHFDPFEDGVKVRLRIDGILQDHTIVPKAYQRNLTTRIKLISNMNITESRLPQDGAIKGSIDTYAVDMRVSSLPIVDGEKIVIRLLDYSKSMEGLENLQFSPTNLEKIIQGINAPNGIILVTGATGSGKSTTVYSILQRLNDVKTNIITVEDPVEMKISGINQVQVMSEIGLTFGAALRSILRQDPDTIMIGEIRDDETARIAVRASITGHLVLSTIHTNNALTTIERLLDMDVERYLLSSALTGIVSQKLARRLCPHCKELRKTTTYEKEIFKRALNKDVSEIYDAKGCENCRNGYTGRIAIQEVLLIDDYLRDAINDEMLQREDLRKLVYTENVTTLLQDGLEKVLAGITSFNEIYRLIEIDDELDSHYSDEMLGNKMYTEELDQNVEALGPTTNPTENIITDKPAAAKTEEELGKTEVLDLGTMN